MDKYIEYFINYVTMNYDIEDELIVARYYHSLRVARLMAIIAKKMNMSDDDIVLAFKIGLCHDLGRFYEITLYDGHNSIGFDHGNYSNRILYEEGFIEYMDITEHSLFQKAIYYHNKKEIPNNLTIRESIFVNMLRDADKIDIMILSGEVENDDFDKLPSEEVLTNYQSNLPLDIRKLNNSSDKIVLHLSFIKDLYFDVSYDIAIDYGYLDIFLSSFNVTLDMQPLLDSLVNKIYERRGKEYAR